MYILNKFDVMHTWPDDMPLPKGARKASKDEISAWQAADAESAAVILEQKQASAQARAQVVVMAAPEPEKAKPAAKSAAKKGDDD